MGGMRRGSLHPGLSPLDKYEHLGCSSLGFATRVLQKSGDLHHPTAFFNCGISDLARAAGLPLSAFCTPFHHICGFLSTKQGASISCRSN